MTATAASLEILAAHLGEALLRREERLATAESCTGGLVSAALTAIAGSSRWFECGFVTYSNAAKQTMLAVPGPLLEEFGAVSESVVLAMADGALAHSNARWSLAISGIAGPDGGSTDKPVGTVWIAWAGPERWRRAEKYRFSGDRRAVREQSAERAIDGLLDRLEGRI